MKKIKKGIRREYSAVKLYLDDIKKIIAVIEELRCKTTITTDDYEFDSFGEFSKEYKDINSINHLKILAIDKTANYDISVEVGYRVYLSMSDNSMRSKGALSDIENILKRRFRYNNWYWVPYIFLISGFVLILNKNAIELLKDKGISAPVYAFLLVFLIILAFWFFYRLCMLHSKIILKYKKEIPGFLKRNKDKILVGIICAIFSGMISFFVAYFLIKK